jgi:hypothetical protein
LNAFWKVILPVPVTLKRFLALELVFTFGISWSFLMNPDGGFAQAEHFWSRLGSAKVWLFRKKRNKTTTIMQST